MRSENIIAVSTEPIDIDPKMDSDATMAVKIMPPRVIMRTGIDCLTT